MESSIAAARSSELSREGVPRIHYDKEQPERRMNSVNSILAVLGAVSLLTAGGAAHAGATLDAVKKKGFVQCGVSDGLPGFSYVDAQGRYLGIDVDVCRAVAAAVFGDASKVKYSPLTAKERFTALQSGEIDVRSEERRVGKEGRSRGARYQAHRQRD